MNATNTYKTLLPNMEQVCLVLIQSQMTRLNFCNGLSQVSSAVASANPAYFGFLTQSLRDPQLKIVLMALLTHSRNMLWVLELL